MSPVTECDAAIYTLMPGFTQAAVKDYQKKRSAGKSPQAAMAEVRQEQQAATA